MRDALPALRQETEIVRAGVAELKEATPVLQQRGAALWEAASGIATSLVELQEGFGQLEGKLGRSQEAMAPLAEDIAQLNDTLAALRDAVAPLRETAAETAGTILRESRQEIAPLKQEIGALGDSARLVQETLVALKEMIAPIQGTSLRAAESSRSTMEGIAALRQELQEARAALNESRTALPRLEEEMKRLRESGAAMEDRLSGLKEAIVPLRELATQAATAAQTGAAGLAALREESRSLPAALRAAREEIEAAVLNQAEADANLQREIGGKVMEEISLVLTEVRRTSAQAPEALAALARDVAEARTAQKETAKSLGRLRDLVEQNPSAELTLAAIQQMQQQNEGSAAGISRLEAIVRGGDEALRKMRESHESVVKAFEGYHQAAREEEERIRRKTAQEHNNRGVILYYRGALKPAEASFRKALEVDPRYAEAWNNLGLVLSRLGKGDDAGAAFQKAIEIDPEMGEVYNNLGFLYHTSLQYDRALEMFNRALQTSSDAAVAYTNLGNTYYKLSRHEQAIQSWKRALELDPLNENARRCLRMYQQENA